MEVNTEKEELLEYANYTRLSNCATRAQPYHPLLTHHAVQACVQRAGVAHLALKVIVVDQRIELDLRLRNKYKFKQNT